MNNFLKRNGIIFGIILGILLIIPSIIGYFVDINFMLNNFTFIGVFISVIVIGIICISVAKKKFQGIISLKEAFSTYLIMLVISLLISTLFNFVMFNIVDKEFPNQLTEKRIENMQSQFEDIKNNPDTTESDLTTYQEQFDKTITQLRSENAYSLSSLFKGFSVFLAIFSIFGLLLGMILKTK